LTSWTFQTFPVRRAIFGSQQTYERWLTLAKAMEQTQGRKSPPLFTVLSLNGSPQGEGGLAFAPASLARFMSDPQAGRALLFALKAPNTLAQSQIATRVKAESIVAMHEEMQTRRL
jgi:hypothetical protein